MASVLAQSNMAPVLGYDQEKEVKEFDDEKIGVKGLSMPTWPRSPSSSYLD